MGEAQGNSVTVTDDGSGRYRHLINSLPTRPASWRTVGCSRRVFKTDLLNSIATRHHRSVAQVVLRWLIQQQGVVALSRTESIERIRSNTQIFDFFLTDGDMAAISALQAPGSRIVNPAHLAPDWD